MILTKNFSKSEFDCKCGCKMPLDVLENVKELAESLQIIRNKLRKSIKVNSGYRCTEHNRNVGGSPNSQHLLGKASDIVISGKKPSETYDFINKLMGLDMIKVGGLGKYNTFTHYDIRGYNARWDFSK